MKISIIIPFKDSLENLSNLFNSLKEQSYKNFEIILIDSSNDDKVFKLLKSFSYLKIFHKKINTITYPGAARNIGVRYSKSEYLLFLDSKTFPKDINWLKNKIMLFDQNKQIKLVFGKTKFFYKTLFQRYLKAATFGNLVYSTLPGTLINKKYFEENQNFLNHVRSGEDIYWRNQFSDNSNVCEDDENNYLTYENLPKNIIEVFLKFTLYSFHSARINIQNQIKDLYLSLFLLLCTLIIPRWNYIISDWENNVLYLPNVTKIFLITIISIYLIYICLKYFFLKNLKSNFFINTYTIIILLSLFYVAFNWNRVIANWVEQATFYIPHITKIFLFIIFSLSLIFRGIIIPTRKKINFSFIFPFNWIILGILGLFIDIIKAPCYFLGAVISPFHNLINKNKNIKNRNKKILIICPFPKGVQAGQRLKYEMHLKTFENNGYSIDISSFINLNTWNFIFKKGYLINKIIATFSGYLRRTSNLFILHKYDFIYVFMWITPFHTNIYEKLFFKFSKKIIFDIEDNVFLPKKNVINPLIYFLKSEKKILYLVKNSNQIITSAPDLNNKCLQISKKNNSTYISPSIDFSRYINKNLYNYKDEIVIGWTGTFSSLEYLKKIEKIISDISKIRKIKFLVIGNFNYHPKNINYQYIEWNKNNEISDLNKIDIGVYPLPSEDDWVIGKSGLKAIQYMALGIPTIATNVGNNKNIITNMKDGILVNNNKEWFESLLKLIDSSELRKNIGKSGINTIKKNFSEEIIAKKYLDVFKKLL